MDALPAAVAQALRTEFSAKRSLAWLRIDPALALVDAGGQLSHYGLDGLRFGAPAGEQLVFLDGFLPLVESPFLLRAVELAAGRATDIHLHALDGQSWVVLLDVTAERDDARRMQQKAYDTTLLQEREARLNRELAAANVALREAQREIEASRAALQRVHDRLSLELADAAAYVRSILPPPMRSPFEIDWRFVPSAQLGGDAFGYHWIDDAHFALYLLDVCGHGIGPSLLSVGVLNSLRSGSLVDVDPRDPTQVLKGLNRLYPMAAHNDLFFTLWYGVYSVARRSLAYSAAGHPPALLVHPDDPSAHRPASLPDSKPLPGARAEVLATRGPPIGTVADAAWHTASTIVPERSRLYLFSDGAFEIRRADGSMLPFDGFVDLVSSLGTQPVAAGIDRLIAQVFAQAGGDPDDDLSIVGFAF